MAVSVVAAGIMTNAARRNGNSNRAPRGDARRRVLWAQAVEREAATELESRAMSKEPRQIALERIAAEKAARTGRLDIGNLGLERLPDELFQLEWLEELVLGGDGKGVEPDRRNCLVALPPLLPCLPHLRVLDCSQTDLR